MKRNISGMAHERIRFKEMTPSQLITRLNKITHVDKLQCYIIVAQEVGYPKLAGLAQEKLYKLQYGVSMPPKIQSVKFINSAKVAKPIVLTKAEEIIITQEIYSVRPVRRFDFD